MPLNAGTYGRGAVTSAMDHPPNAAPLTIGRLCVASLAPIPTPHEPVYSSATVGSPPKVVAWAHKFGHLRAMARSSKAAYGNAASGQPGRREVADDTAIEATIASEQAPLTL